ncbi:MAG: hypothetical protein WCC08_22235 [Terrimicrobiaceae bacterium]
MTTTSKGYGDYVVFVESKALRGRSKQEYLRQVRKLGEHYAGRELAGVTEREVFDYLVHRREVEKLRPSTLNPGGGGTADVLPRLPGQAVGAVGAL